MIPFNKPFIIGNEINYITQAVASGKISGDGMFTKKCHDFFEETFGFKKCLLTTSCTDALEMAAILCNIQPGDEVIAPSYTFVSTVNAFVLRGAKIVFVDSGSNNPNLDVASIEALITDKTKAIVAVHYAGVACDMEALQSIVEKHHLFLIEDAAQAIDSYYKSKPLGSFGHFAAFSFHETKNIISGEGGMLVINDLRFAERAEIIREKGTDRSKFFRGEIDKYGWVDIGSSFLPSDIIAAFLWAQLEKMDTIQQKRKSIWSKYQKDLSILEKQNKLQLPIIPADAYNNAHMFYLICKSLGERNALIQHLKEENIMATFHYVSLHKSKFYINENLHLPNTERYSDCLIRLPFYFELTEADQNKIITSILNFFQE